MNESMNQWINDEAVCRTAPATPGLLKNILKAMIACAKAPPQIEARFGPFFNSSTWLPNPDPDFAAEQLNKQYSGGFVKPKAAWAVLSQAELFWNKMKWKVNDFNFDEKDIEYACSQLKTYLAPGPDGISAELLKNNREELSKLSKF